MSDFETLSNSEVPGSSGEDQPQLASQFPLPPVRYIKLYNDQNIERKQAPIPPNVINGQFQMFGTSITMDDSIIRSLESNGLRRLYPREYDYKKEMKKINQSINVNFLDLIDILILCPDSSKREEKCNDLKLLFINFHHLINELRTHQARESIRVSLLMQKKQTVETTEKLFKTLDHVSDMVKTTTKVLVHRDVSTILKDTDPNSFLPEFAQAQNRNKL